MGYISDCPVLQSRLVINGNSGTAATNNTNDSYVDVVMPAQVINEHGNIQTQNWDQLILLCKELIDVCDKQKYYVKNEKKVLFKPRKSSLSVCVGMLVLHGIYGVPIMTGKGPLNSIHTWKNAEFKEKVINFLLSINSIRPFVEVEKDKTACS